MSEPAAPRRALPAPSYSRLLMFIAFVCLLIAALTVAGAFNIGPALAWVFGGLAAWALASVV